MKIFVTGGAGFIGHHTVRGLLSGGHQVAVLDNLSTGRFDRVPAGIRFFQNDILDPDALESCMKEFQPEAVLHLAARVSIRNSMDHFTEDAMQNFIGTSRVLEASVRAEVRRFVMASSMAVYDDAPDPLPIREDWPKNPQSPYGISKYAAEQLLHQVGRQNGMETLALRFFNTFGTGQTLTPYVGVITIFVNKILDRQPLNIFGDGRQCRDFVNVGDIAKACQLALECSHSGVSINVGSGKGTTVNQLASLLLRKMNSALEPVYLPARPEELRNSVADIQAAGALLNYVPDHTLENSIEEVIQAIQRSRS